MTFNPESLIGIPHIFDVYRKGNVALLNSPGNGIADDKGIYYFVPKMIEYLHPYRQLRGDGDRHAKVLVLCHDNEGVRGHRVLAFARREFIVRVLAAHCHGDLVLTGSVLLCIGRYRNAGERLAFDKTADGIAELRKVRADLRGGIGAGNRDRLFGDRRFYIELVCFLTVAGELPGPAPRRSS